MAGKKIRGITVQLGGDTTGLRKALTDADKALAATQKELNEVKKGLKFDPGNAKLAAQQQELLSQAIKQTSEKLRALEENQDKVNKAFRANGAWEAQYQPIKERIEQTSKALEDLRKAEEDFKRKHESGKISDDEYEEFVKNLKAAEQAAKDARKEKTELDKKFQDGHINAEQYREYEREVEKTRAQLAKMQDDLNKSGKAADENAKEMKKAAKSIDDVDDSAKQANESLGRFGKDLKDDVKSATKVVAALSAAILAVGKSSVDAGAEFDAAMSKVIATLGFSVDEVNTAGTKAAKTYEALRDYAQQMGKSTAYSATESAEALNYMAMAGWNDEQMLAGLDDVLNLAAASGADLATTSDIVTDALTAMGYSAEDAGRLADVMAAASSNANTNVEMMGETFKYAAPLAGSLGYSMEDTATAIALMANSGIKASSAGTALRGWLSKLAAPTKDSQKAMEELGITLTDEEGNMKSLRDVIGDTRTAFADLSEAEKAQYAKMMAGQQGLSGFLAIVNAAPEDLDKLTNAIDNSAGAAKAMSEVRIDNLEGDVTILKSAVEGAQIAISDKLTPSIRKYTQIGTKTVTAMADAFGKNGLEGAVEAAHQTLDKEMGDDAKTVFAVETAVKALTAAFIAYKGALVLSEGIDALKKVNAALAEGKALSEAMAKAQLANPYVLLAAAVTAAVVAFKSYKDLQTDLIDETADSYATFSAEQQEVIDKTNDTAAALNASRQEYENNVKAIELDEKQTALLVDRLYDLDGIQSKDAAKKAEMAAIVDQLNGSVEGLNLKYDEQTGKLNKTKDAVDQLVSSYFEEAKAEAYKNRLVKLIEEQAEAEENHEKAVRAVEVAEGKRISTQNRLNSVTASYNRNAERILELDQEMSKGNWTAEKEAEYNSLTEANGKLAESMQSLQGEIDNIDLGMGDLYATQVTAKDALDNTSGSIDMLRDKMGEASVEVPEESAAISAGIDGINAVMEGVSQNAGATHNSLVEAFYISEDLEPALSEVYDLVDEYNKELESRKGALQSWFEGSVTVKEEDLSMNSMWAALNSTTTRLDDWQAKIDKLTDEGINDKYLQHLKDAGPESLNEINQLFTVPEDTRKKYADQWADGYERAAEVAEKQMQAAKEETNTKIGEIIKTISDNSPQMKDTFNQLGIDGVDGYIQAFSDPQKLQELKEAVRQMVEIALAEVQATQDSNSPAKEFDYLGEDAGDGYALGYEKKETEVQKAAREMALSAIKAVEDVGKTGLKAPSGFAESIKESLSSIDVLRGSLQSNANDGNLVAKPPESQQIIVKMDPIVTKTYLDSREIAESVAEPLDAIYALKAESAGRGHA